jgi:hypothetical protein
LTYCSFGGTKVGIVISYAVFNLMFPDTCRGRSYFEINIRCQFLFENTSENTNVEEPDENKCFFLIKNAFTVIYLQFQFIVGTEMNERNEIELFVYEI